MKLKKIEVTHRYLKKRFITSFSIGICCFVLGIIVFKYIQNSSERIDGTPVLLRHSFVWNQKVWSKLSTHNKLNLIKTKKSLKGLDPRVNGDIGLSEFQESADIKNYSIEVISGSTKLNLPVSSFKSTPKIGYTSEFRCIEGWSEDTQYAGTRFSDFMAFYDLGKKSDGTYYQYVGLETPDKKYYVSIDIESMLHPQTILAYEMNEEPISDDNGAPLRLIIPIKYGIKSLKRIGRIVFSDTRPPDYWAERGYDWYSGF